MGKAPLELMHTNIVGPMKKYSIGRSTYFMTFTDYFSHRIWMCIFKNKFEAFDKAIEFKA